MASFMKTFKNRLSPKRLTKKQKFFLVLIVVLIAGLWFVWKQINAPVEGAATQADSSSIEKTSKKPPTGKQTKVENDYFSLKLPVGYRLQADSNSVPGLLDQRTLIKSSTRGSVVLSIAVKKLPEGGMSEDSAYQLRAKNPSRYAIEQETISGSPVTLVEDRQDGSVVAFMSNGGIMATIGSSSGISSPGGVGNDAQRRALLPLIENWQWR